MNVTLSPSQVAWQLPGSVEDWLSKLPVPAASAVANALEAGVASVVGHTLTATAQMVATWPEVAALALGLPPNSPLGFDIRLSGAMGKPGASISVRWLQPGRTVPARDATRSGLWLESSGKTYRIPSPIFEVLAIVEDFNRVPADDLEEQFRLWATIRQSLGEDSAAALTDGFLRSFRVVTASSLTFSITTDERGDVQLDPVLLTAKRAADGEDFDQIRALTESDEALFPKRLDQLREGAPAFPISQGTYVVVDESLQQALVAVRKLRKSSAEQRKRAAMYPEAVIKEMLGLEEDAPSPFVETERFAERVRDVGEWAAPVLPWIKIAPQAWGAPSTAGVRVGGVDVPLDKKELTTAVAAMRDAIATGAKKASVGGKDIPATTANLNALAHLQRTV